MIKKVRLINWKSHKDSVFEFEKGTNVLIGVIGAGKSAIMDGLCYALFGTFPALNSKRLSLDEVIMNKPSEMDYAKIELGFEYNGKTFLVERSIFKGKKANEAKLFCGDEFLAGPKTGDVNKKIEEILEINYELFSRAVYSEQNQIDFFLRLSPRERKQKFDELLDLEKYEKVRSNAVSLNNRLKKTTEDKQKWLKEIQEKVDEKRIIEQEKKLKIKETLNKELTEKIEKEKKELDELKKQLKETEGKEKEFNSLKELKSRAEGKIDSLKKEVDGKKLTDEKSLKEKIEKENAKENEIKKGIELEIEEIAVLESKESEAKKFLHELKKAKSRCPICESSLEEEKKKELNQRKENELNELKEKMEDNKKRRIEWEKKLKEKHEEIKLLEKEIELSKKAMQLRELENELEKTMKKLKELNHNEKESLELTGKTCPECGFIGP